ncbi:MAG: 3'-5' exonuclease [Rhizorhabdus sp.]|uniref:3'-5' exonuclease n=1 Tax=Rhizorhabdus sp. TaxID=1968843 RepID=UPI001B5B46F9|nr:3'-5' exonuclease [Rhizorhabdus sp.]MBP8231582.1 3'-5' exonuclease [Rhizorhabdus sp.]
MNQRMWAVDVEGNGGSPAEIVELAIVEMEGLQLTGRYKHWRFKPKGGITPIVSRIHGIWERDVADAPEIEDVIDDVFEWLEDAPIVGHNVRVELEIIGRAMEDWQPSAAFDTLRIARRLVPNEKKHGLEYLGNTLGLLDAAGAATGGGSHSAPFDAALSAILLQHLLAPLSEAERQAVMEDADILRVQQGSLL